MRFIIGYSSAFTFGEDECKGANQNTFPVCRPHYSILLYLPTNLSLQVLPFLKPVKTQTRLPSAHVVPGGKPQPGATYALLSVFPGTLIF